MLAPCHNFLCQLYRNPVRGGSARCTHAAAQSHTNEGLDLLEVQAPWYFRAKDRVRDGARECLQVGALPRGSNDPINRPNSANAIRCFALNQHPTDISPDH